MLVCRICGGALEAGTALIVRPAGQAPSFMIHRPSIEARCIQRTGRASEFAIALLDLDAAREFDRRHAGRPPAIADTARTDPRGRAPWRASPA